MHSLNITQFMPTAFEKLSHKLPNYTVINYDSPNKKN